MEEVLKKLGISENTIKEMQEKCEDIKDLSIDEMIDKIKILTDENCNKIQVRNIISSNPMYLDRTNADINNLIKKLKQFGFTNLDLLFDGNPYILNLDDFEIEEYIKNRETNGENLEDIVDDLSLNLYIFDEI